MIVNKSNGTTLAAVALGTATIVFRSAVPLSAPSQSTAHNLPTANKPADKRAIKDGPWMASCDYWAPARAAAAEMGESECGGDAPWGLPDSNIKPEIKVLIALVPDPVRTNMSLQFDQTIDALMEAAGDNGYVSSYYW